MKLLLTFALLLLVAMVGFTGCYTQLGYYASTDFDGRYHKVLKKEKMEHTSKSKSESEESKSEEHTNVEEHTDVEDSEGYYGRRKYTHRNRSVSPYRHDTYWVPYAPHPYYAYSPLWYHPSPWFYGYHAPYYRYYRSYYPYYGYGYYRGYYPYTNVYRRYHRGSRYVPLSQRTYNNRGAWRSSNQRSRSSRSVTSQGTRSARPQRRVKTRNEN